VDLLKCRSGTPDNSALSAPPACAARPVAVTMVAARDVLAVLDEHLPSSRCVGYGSINIRPLRNAR